MNKVDLSSYQNTLGFKNKAYRFVWNIVWIIFARPFHRRLANKWKLFLLRLFGAEVHNTSVVYSSARIYLPSNLVLEEYACIGPEVDCYNPAKITIGAHTTISQKSYLCSASHDISLSHNPLITEPIIIKDQVWIGAASYVGLGVTIGQGAVVGATASVYKDVEPWTIVGGNPAKFIKKRNLK